jgi:hypothetical protein
MALTINSAVSGGRRLWVRNSMLHTAGVVGGALVSVLSAAAVVAVTARIEAMPVLRASACALVVLALCRDMGLNAPVPYGRSQVPEYWRDMMPLGVVALAYGLLLGTGFLTRYVGSPHLAMIALITLVGGPQTILIGCGAYAVGKVAVLATGGSASRVADVERELSWDCRGAAAIRVVSCATSLFAVGLLAFSI